MSQTLRNVPWRLKSPPFKNHGYILSKMQNSNCQFSHSADNRWPTHTGNLIPCLGFFLLLGFQAPFARGLGGASKEALFSGWGLPLHLSSEMFSVSTCQRQEPTCPSTEQLLSASELEMRHKCHCHLQIIERAVLSASVRHENPRKGMEF